MNMKTEKMIDHVFQCDAAVRFIQKFFRGYRARKRIEKIKTTKNS